MPLDASHISLTDALRPFEDNHIEYALGELFIMLDYDRWVPGPVDEHGTPLLSKPDQESVVCALQAIAMAIGLELNRRAKEQRW